MSKFKTPLNSKRKRNAYGILGAFLIGLSALALLTVAEMESAPLLVRALEFNWSSDVHRKIFSQCLDLHNQLDELKLPHEFSEISINLIDPLPEKIQIQSALAGCLKKNIQSKLSIQGEVFNSDFEGKDGNVVILQLSLMDQKKNKIMELNHHWTTTQFKPSDDVIGNKKGDGQKDTSSTKTESQKSGFDDLNTDSDTSFEKKAVN